MHDRHPGRVRSTSDAFDGLGRYQKDQSWADLPINLITHYVNAPLPSGLSDTLSRGKSEQTTRFLMSAGFFYLT